MFTGYFECVKSQTVVGIVYLCANAGRFFLPSRQAKDRGPAPLLCWILWSWARGMPGLATQTSGLSHCCHEFAGIQELSAQSRPTLVYILIKVICMSKAQQCFQVDSNKQWLLVLLRKCQLLQNFLTCSFKYYWKITGIY